MDRQKVQEVIAALRARRAGMTLGGLGWKELRDAGRRLEDIEESACPRTADKRVCAHRPRSS